MAMVVWGDKKFQSNVQKCLVVERLMLLILTVIYS